MTPEEARKNIHQAIVELQAILDSGFNVQSVQVGIERDTLDLPSSSSDYTISTPTSRQILRIRVAYSTHVRSKLEPDGMSDEHAACIRFDADADDPMAGIEPHPELIARMRGKTITLTFTPSPLTDLPPDIMDELAKYALGIRDDQETDEHPSTPA